MTESQNQGKDSEFALINPDGKIQNRLTVAGFGLAILVFSVNLSLGISKAYDLENEFLLRYSHLLVALSLGLVFGFIAVTFFLQSQQVREDSTKKTMFSIGQLALYVMLSQAFSATGTEVVFGIRELSQDLSEILAIISTLVWLLLLFVFPGFYLRRANSRWLSSLYAIFLLTVLTTNACAYNQREKRTGFKNLTQEVVRQCIQPYFWSKEWNVGSKEE